MHSCMHAYIHTCMHTCIDRCIHTYIHTYICTYIHAYIYTYIHSYIHTYTCTHNLLKKIYTHRCIHAYIDTLYIYTDTHTHFINKLRTRACVDIMHDTIHSIYVCIHTQTNVFMHVCIDKYVQTYTHKKHILYCACELMHVYAYVCMNDRPMYVHIHMRLCIYKNIHVCIHVYIHV